MTVLVLEGNVCKLYVKCTDNFLPGDYSFFPKNSSHPDKFLTITFNYLLIKPSNNLRPHFCEFYTALLICKLF